MKRVLKKIVVYTLLMILAVVGASVIATFLYKDRLIDHFIREANKNLNTPIQVDKIMVSPLSNFPQVSLVFKGVVMEESFDKSTYPLLEAARIDFTFNPFNLWEGKYIIEEIHLKDASCHLKVNKNGETNYNIAKQPGGGAAPSVTFDLSRIFLDNVNFRYSSDRNDTYIEASAKKATAKLEVDQDVYNTIVSGDFIFHDLKVDQQTWITGKDIAFQAKVVYDDTQRTLDFNSSKLQVAGSDFKVYGDYTFKDKQFIDLNVEGENTNLQTILSLLPSRMSERFKKYQSRGDVYFDLVLKGEISRAISPTLDVNFGLIDCDLFYPDNDVSITGTQARGKFHADDLDKRATYRIALEDVSGSLEGQDFNGNLLYRNFKKPYAKLDFTGDLDVNSLFKFYEIQNIDSASGRLGVNISFEGYLQDLKNKTGASKIKTSGDVNLENVDISIDELKLPLTALNGNLLFNNNDLALSEVRGKLGNSDFLLNGFFKNIIAYALFDNEPVGIESTLVSDFIDLDQLLSVSNQEQEAPTGEYVFQLSPRLRLKFNCNIKSLKFRRFTARNIRGDLKIKDQVALAEELNLEAMGGKLNLSGLVDTRNVKDIKVNTSSKLNRIDVDSIFYVFENFNQNFLEDRHLKGKIMAEVAAEMHFNENLELFPETLTSTISTSIIGGELNDFEPMQRLDRYLDGDKLDHLKFSELKNDIYIDNKTIYLPQMEVGSNVTNIKISGTHTFDQKIDYRVIAPLRSRRKIDKDEAFGAIEEHVTGQSRLYLKIVGTAADYRVVYDKEGVKQKIASDLQKEMKELKRAFKNKGLKKQQTIELEEDDYFDWDEGGEN